MQRVTLIVLVLISLSAVVYGFAGGKRFAPRAGLTVGRSNGASSSKLHMLDMHSTLAGPALWLSDTSITEEDVLEVTGRVANLPDPMIAISIAAVVFLGVAVLQFSLGDLATQV